MLEWFSANFNLPTIVIVLILVVIIVWDIRKLLEDRKKGCSACGCSCSGCSCSGCSGCGGTKVDLKKGVARVTFDREIADEQITETVTEEGYEVTSVIHR